MTAVIEAVGLSKRYRTTWGLRDCTFTVPAGRVAALVGPNAAGKSTLLRIAAGLCSPTTGYVWVLGEDPGRASVDHIARVGYLDQERPLYRSFRVGELLRFGRALNRRWDADRAKSYLTAIDISPSRPVGKLSAGQQAQVAVALCLAKQPDLLLLDEPLASLDPLARQQVLHVLMETVEDRSTTIVFSSHVISDLEGVCDFLVLLSDSRVQVADDIDQLLATHRTLVGPRREDAFIPGAEILTATHTGRMSTLLVRIDKPITDPAWQISEPSLEEIILGYLHSPSAFVPRPLYALGGQEGDLARQRRQ